MIILIYLIIQPPITQLSLLAPPPRIHLALTGFGYDVLQTTFNLNYLLTYPIYQAGVRSNVGIT